MHSLSNILIKKEDAWEQDHKVFWQCSNNRCHPTRACIRSGERQKWMHLKRSDINKKRGGDISWLWFNNVLIKNKLRGAYFNKDMQGRRRVYHSATSDCQFSFQEKKYKDTDNGCTMIMLMWRTKGLLWCQLPAIQEVIRLL